MAKKIINDNTEKELDEKTGTTPVVNTEKETEAVKAVSRDIPDFIDEILKLKPEYETLYVDIQGGTYTAETPKAIRRKAVLYKNPHYKPL